MDFVVNFFVATFCFFLASTTANNYNDISDEDVYVIPLSDIYKKKSNLNKKIAPKSSKSTTNILLTIVPDNNRLTNKNNDDNLIEYQKSKLLDLLSNDNEERHANKVSFYKEEEKPAGLTIVELEKYLNNKLFNTKLISVVRTLSNYVEEDCPTHDIQGKNLPAKYLSGDCAILTKSVAATTVGATADADAKKSLVLNFDYGKAKNLPYWLSKAVSKDSKDCVFARDKKGNVLFGHHPTEKVCKDARWSKLSFKHTDKVFGWAETKRTPYHFIPIDKLKKVSRTINLKEFKKLLPFDISKAKPLNDNNNAIGWTSAAPPHWLVNNVASDSEECIRINDGAGRMLIGYHPTSNSCKDTRFIKTFYDSEVIGARDGGDLKAIGWTKVDHDEIDDDDGHINEHDNEGTGDDNRYHSDVLSYSQIHPLRLNPNINENILEGDVVVVELQ